MTGDFNALIEETYGHEAVGSGFVVLHGNENNTLEDFFRTREEAVAYAQNNWNHLSSGDKKTQLVEAVRIEWELFDGMAVYEQYEIAWSSAVEGRAPSGATSALVRILRGGIESFVSFGMDGEYFDADHAFNHARSVLEEVPAASVCVEFFRDEGDEFDELGIIEVV